MVSLQAIGADNPREGHSSAQGLAMTAWWLLAGRRPKSRPQNLLATPEQTGGAMQEIQQPSGAG